MQINIKNPAVLTIFIQRAYAQGRQQKWYFLENSAGNVHSNPSIIGITYFGNINIFITKMSFCMIQVSIGKLFATPLAPGGYAQLVSTIFRHNIYAQVMGF